MSAAANFSSRPIRNPNDHSGTGWLRTNIAEYIIPPAETLPLGERQVGRLDFGWVCLHAGMERRICSACGVSGWG